MPGEIGAWLALIVGIGGGVGNYLGGVLADRFAQQRSDAARVRVPVLTMLLGLPAGSSSTWATAPPSRCAAFVLAGLLGLMYQAPTFAVTQFLATPKMRATAAAVLLFVINIIGLAWAPRRRARSATRSLRVSATIRCATRSSSSPSSCSWSALHF